MFSSECSRPHLETNSVRFHFFSLVTRPGSNQSSFYQCTVVVAAVLLGPLCTERGERQGCHPPPHHTREGRGQARRFFVANTNVCCHLKYDNSPGMRKLNIVLYRNLIKILEISSQLEALQLCLYFVH